MGESWAGRFARHAAIILLVGGCFLVSGVRPVAAGMLRMEGFYEFRTDINQEASAFNPNIGTQDRTDRGAKNYFQGRLYADPAPYASMYTKLELDSKSNDDQLRFAEGHVFLKKEFRNKGFEWFLFDSEERLFLNDPLLGITSGKSDLRGFRGNFWGWNGWVNIYQGKFKASSGNDDVYAIRAGRNFLRQNKLTVATTANTRGWTGGRNAVGAMDVTYRFQEAEIIVEGATSHTSSVTRRDATAFKTELKNIRMSSRRLGTLRLTSNYRNWGDGYRNYLGDNPDKKEDGLYTELVYEVPYKAMRFTFRNDMKEENRRTVLHRSERRVKYWYGEMFAEFNRGYKFKAFYDYYNDAFNDNLRRPNLFFQIENYSRYNTLKAQFKYKDWNNRYEKVIFGLEDRHTLTERLFFTVRTMHVFEEESTSVRNSLFVQISYKVRENGNVFLEYGNQYQGDNDVINDGDFADNSSANTDRAGRVMLQLWW